MKTSKTVHDSIDLSTTSIPEAEEIIEDALSELSYSQDPGLARALRFLAPVGYEVVVELCSENGRSKRRTAVADTWSPEEDEIRIYFERSEGVQPEPRPVRPARSIAAQEEALAEAPISPVEMDAHVHELCEALAEAERGGHAFIALKWFRDSFLPRKSYRWNQHPESRQAVLAEAIQRGVVMTSKIANPKTPAYPTTTIRLNRAEAGIAEDAPRLQPVPLEGEPLAETIDDERGNE